MGNFNIDFTEGKKAPTKITTDSNTHSKVASLFNATQDFKSFNLAPK